MPTSPRSSSSRARNTDSQPVFNLSAVKVEARSLPFRFAWKGKRYEVDALGSMDGFDTMDALTEHGDAAGLYLLFKRSLGADALEELRGKGVTGGHLAELFKAWQEHSGLTPGESEGSTDS